MTATRLTLQRAILQASLDPEQWGEVLDGFRREMDTAGAMMLVRCSEDQQYPRVFSSNVSPNFMVRHHSIDISINPVQQAVERVPPMALYTDESLPKFLGGRTLVNTHYYNHVFRPEGFRYAAGSVLKSDNQERIVFGLYRERGQGAFDAHEQEYLRSTIPLLEHAVTVARWLEYNSLKCKAADAMCNDLSAGLIITDDRASILYSNKTAETLLQRRDGITVEGGRLVGYGRNRAKCVAEKIMATSGFARNNGKGRRVGAPLSLTVSRRDGIGSLRLMFLPIDGGECNFAFSSGAVLVLITTPGDRFALPLERWRVAYHLTGAETEFLKELADTGSTREAAGRRNISYHTARQYTKNILLKTGVNSQIKLMSLLLSEVTEWAAGVHL